MFQFRIYGYNMTIVWRKFINDDDENDDFFMRYTREEMKYIIRRDVDERPTGMWQRFFCRKTTVLELFYLEDDDRQTRWTAHPRFSVPLHSFVGFPRRSQFVLGPVVVEVDVR